MDRPATKFAPTADGDVAYRVFGDGPVDHLYLLNEYIPVDAIDEEPRYARALRRLSAFGRVVVLNRRGVGLSDPPTGPLTQGQHVEDALAVLDHIGSPQAIVYGSHTSGPASMCFAAQHPNRTAALVLINTYARFTPGANYPLGLPRDFVEGSIAQFTDTNQDDSELLSLFAPSVATDVRFRTWWESAGHRGATPARSRDLYRLHHLETDVRSLLGEIVVPTLVVQRVGGILGTELSRYLADNIAGARYVELPDPNLFWWIGDSDAVLDAIETFVAVAGARPAPRRRLATVLFCDIVGSTEHLSSIGDSRWGELVRTFFELAELEADRHGGRVIGTAGDEFLAVFELPTDAIHCASTINDGVKALDIEVRAGIHTGEVEMLGAEVAGIAVHIASRVMNEAGSGEVLVSSTVKELMIGSGIGLVERGEHALKGVNEKWRLFAVE